MANPYAISAAPPPPPAPRGIAWISAKEAATRAGQSERNVTRRCGEEWLARGLARFEPPTPGRKSCWSVREDADPAFARVQFAATLTTRTDLTQLTPEQRAVAFARDGILAGWRQAKEAGFKAGQNPAAATAAHVKLLADVRGLKVSPRTLQLWQSRYDAGGFAGLADGRSLAKSNRAVAAADDPFVVDLKALYLSDRKPSKKACWLMACWKAEQEQRPAMEERSACRVLEKIDRRTASRFRDGPSAYAAKCEPSIERDYSTLHTNQEWVGDHHQLDIIANIGGGRPGRPWLTAWQDMRSRRIVGWCMYAHDPNQNAILSALRSGCEGFGVPGVLYVDDGKDFDSYTFHGRTKQERRRRAKVELDAGHAGGILGRLGCNARFCWPYHGQSKPIERFFRTMASRFSVMWPTYCGNKPENKPEGLQGRLERGQAPALADVVAAFGEWVERDYNAAPHKGDSMDGRSPIDVYDASWGGTAKRAAQPDLLALLLMKTSRPVKAGKTGVTLSGLRYGQYSPELIPWFGKEVYLRIDERDVSRVQVWTPEDRFVCIAPANERIPHGAKDEQALRNAIAARSKHKRLVREYHEARPRLADDLPSLMTQAAAAQHAAARLDNPPEPPAGPASVAPIRSGMEDQLSKLQRAIDREQRAPRVAPEDDIDLLGAMIQSGRKGAAEPGGFSALRDYCGRDEVAFDNDTGGFIYPDKLRATGTDDADADGDTFDALTRMFDRRRREREQLAEGDE